MGEGGRPTVTREHRKLIIENAGSAQVLLWIIPITCSGYESWVAGKRKQQCGKKQREGWEAREREAGEAWQEEEVEVSLAGGRGDGFPPRTRRLDDMQEEGKLFGPENMKIAEYKNET